MKRTIGGSSGQPDAGVLFGAPAPPPADPLTPAALQRCLRAAVFGSRVFYYPTIGSTNDRALELASAGEAEGGLVLAEEQTLGRGRRARSWTSPPHSGIYASLILRPGLPATRAPLLTLIAAVAISEALREAAALQARIKWPNDVLVGRRKIAGVLGEFRGSEPEIRALVVGLGVNVNHAVTDFPPEIRERATSVLIENGAAAERAPLLAQILEGFERRYGRLLRGETAELLREWESLSAIPDGARVVVEGAAGRHEGSVAGVDDEGALLLNLASGGTLRVPFGEITCLWP
jgi:BirA family transcriptional regulator, biotin operon repressor / biotin---[acetyl-CoA-carboxylase] ligase